MVRGARLTYSHLTQHVHWLMGGPSHLPTMALRWGQDIGYSIEERVWSTSWGFKMGGDELSLSSAVGGSQSNGKGPFPATLASSTLTLIGEVTVMRMGATGQPAIFLVLFGQDR